MKILQSATKVVLLLFAITACVGFLLGKLTPELFGTAMGGVFGFFFAYKGDSSSNTPFAGK